MAKSKKLWIDCAAGSELMDTQGETLSVEGADISELEAGRGRWNDNHGKGNWNSLGMITEAKKIFKAEDCEDDRQRYYWDKIKAAYIYTKGYLYSDEDHGNAKAAAAIIRNIHREDSPLKMKASVEGGVVSRGISDPARLARTKIHSVALTFTPANNATLVEPLNLDKSNVDWEADKQLIKSVMHLAETNVPSFRHITRHASANTIYDNMLKIQTLAKTLGIEVEIKDFNPDVIMEKAVMHKVSANIIRINELVKSVKAVKAIDKFFKPKDLHTTADKYSPGKVKMAVEDKKIESAKDADKFQQDIGKLKSNATTPQKPKDVDPESEHVPIKRAAKVKNINTLKSHANKAMRDPKYLDNLHQGLVNKGVHPNKAKVIVDKIKLHMVKNDDLEKTDIKRAAKNLVVAGAMAGTAGLLSSDKQKPKEAKPKEEKVKPKEEKAAKDPKKFSSDKKGLDRVEDYKKWVNNLDTRKKKLKTNLKKALTAGYGGAGAPGNLSGGGVIQSESLEDGRTRKSETTDGISYISCDSCGYEQAYMKHQVKCRKCNKNFSLNKLQSHM